VDQNSHGQERRSGRQQPVIWLAERTCLPVLYEDRSVLVIDKPSGWILAPESWKNTARNLQRELELAVREGEFWARSRGIRFLRFVHRLDAETTCSFGKRAKA
jgi:23S rRNA-/tRNA-specific pseudouridylate synthase